MRRLRGGWYSPAMPTTTTDPAGTADVPGASPERSAAVAGGDLTGAAPTPTDRDVAVLIPCRNEADAVAGVVRDFRAALPGARIFVYDNNSDDGTIGIARAAGAQVRGESYQGKGHVVRRMFADVEAEVYVLVDGDATYHAPSAAAMVAVLNEQHLDMVVGRRRPAVGRTYRPGHRLGNRLLSGAVRRIFGPAVRDVLSGYRVFSRRFVKSFPARFEAFEIETELTIHALELRLPVAEMDTPYYARPEASHSKLDTWRDGFLILLAIVRLFALEQPLRFFAGVAFVFFAAATFLFAPVLGEFLETRLVPRLPTLVFVVGLYAAAFVSFTVGVVVHAITIGRRETKRLAYLAVRPTGLEPPAAGR